MYYGPLGHTISVDLETEINYTGNQLINCVYVMQSQVKTLNTEAQMSFPGWQYTIHIIKNQHPDSDRREQKKIQVW